MRSVGKGLLGMRAALAIAMLGASAAQEAMPTPRKGGSRDYKPTPKPKHFDTELQREIAAHNEAIERRKADKRAKRLGR